MRIAVFLMGYGGPLSLEDIHDYLKNIWHGKEPSPQAVETMKKKYQIVNGRSPLLDKMEAISNSLKKYLSNKYSHIEWNTFVGMKYWKPFIYQVLPEVVNWKPDKIIAIPIAPHYTRDNGSGEYYEMFISAIQKFIPNKSIGLNFIDGWGLRNDYSILLGAQIKEFIFTNGLSEQDFSLIFTAHSLPLKIGKRVNRYDADVRKSATLIVNKMGKNGKIKWDVGYQSKGLRHGQWLEPFIEEILTKHYKKGIRNVVLVPFGFACENLETLYDLDVEIKEFANELGISILRVPTIGEKTEFIEFLSNIIGEVI